MYACMYMYVCACISIHMYVYIYKCMYTYAYVVCASRIVRRCTFSCVCVYILRLRTDIYLSLYI